MRKVIRRPKNRTEPLLIPQLGHLQIRRLTLRAAADVFEFGKTDVDVLVVRLVETLKYDDQHVV